MNTQNRPRRQLGKATVTKRDFAEILQNRLYKLGVPTSVDTSQAILESILDEIRSQIKKGNRVHINDFGSFYAKRMKRRKVVGGIKPESYNEPFVVPAKTKIGFSSTPSGDKTVSRNVQK
jgi:nucleoid DNA-binding protein